MRPRSGRSSPAIRLITVVLPLPERPKSAVTPGVAARMRLEIEVAAAQGDVDFEHGSTPDAAPQRARRPLGEHQPAQPEQEREPRQPRGERIATGRLQRRVQRKRQRARLARNVGGEGDDRAELAEARRKAMIAPATMPGAISGSVIVQNRSIGPAPRVRAPSSSPGSIASSDSRIARTISGKVMTAVASAAPAEVKARRMPKADSSHAPSGPRVPNTSSRT